LNPVIHCEYSINSHFWSLISTFLFKRIVRRIRTIVHFNFQRTFKNLSRLSASLRQRQSPHLF